MLVAGGVPGCSAAVLPAQGQVPGPTLEALALPASGAGLEALPAFGGIVPVFAAVRGACTAFGICGSMRALMGTAGISLAGGRAALAATTGIPGDFLFSSTMFSPSFAGGTVNCTYTSV